MALYKRFLLVIAAISCAAGVICGVIIAKTNTERRMYGETSQQREAAFNDLPLSFSSVPNQKMPYCHIRSDRASALESVSAVSFRENR